MKAGRPFGWQGERRPSTREMGCPGPQSPRAGHCSAYSGGGRRLCSFLSSRPFQYLKLLSKCCIRLGRSAKAGEVTKLKLNIRFDSVVCATILLLHFCIRLNPTFSLLVLILILIHQDILLYLISSTDSQNQTDANVFSFPPKFKICIPSCVQVIFM